MRDTSHADLTTAFHTRTSIERMRQDAFKRDRASKLREARREVEKGDHYRQLFGIVLFIVALCAWGHVAYQIVHGGAHG